MKYLDSLPTYDLTYDDVFMVPRRSTIPSRLDVDVTSTDGLSLPLPLIAANMTAVTGRRMSETVARRGGIGIIPQDIPPDVVAKTIARVKTAHTVFDTAITVGPSDTVGMALALLPKRAHGVVVVIEEDGVPIGTLSRADGDGVDRFTQVHDVMKTDLVLVSVDTEPVEVFEKLRTSHHSLALAVDERDHLIGAMTERGALRSTLYPPACDSSGRLKIGVAIGISGDALTNAEAALASGADTLVLDTAHGHQGRMISTVIQVRALLDDLGCKVPLVAGNVVTPEGVKELTEAGANILKVGVGPGAMCTTRMQTGVGRPQFSAVLECAEAAKELGASVWADGGVRHPRDVALALAAGAGAVMIGSWFAGTYESPGSLITTEDGRAYKESFGMASARAVRSRTKDRSGFDRARAALFEEGISTARMFLDRDRPGVEDLIDFIISGVRSSCTYAGAASLPEFAENACIGIQSSSGFNEGRPLHTNW
ncbi:MAG: GuaB1 family IMP dehydrogenase-related protein [Propionibacteriaceae bacterium]|nr:GuaB1 family IMP dehydrogenase-related protein [Propionibacteriaceae bacterium]